MALFSRSTPFSRVTALASQRPVHAAFAWLHNNPKTIMDWQTELVRMPGPPFGEEQRARWMAERFAQAGVSDVRIDEIGNVLGYLPAAKLPPESSGPIVVLSAHLDTVFPASTEIKVRHEGERLLAPGIKPGVNRPKIRLCRLCAFSTPSASDFRPKCLIPQR